MADREDFCHACGETVDSMDSWDCRLCGRNVHAACCEGSGLAWSKAGRLSSTCRECQGASRQIEFAKDG